MSRVHYNFSTIDDGNIAFHVTDNKDWVIENRKNVCKKYGYNFSRLKYMDQIHSNIIKIVQNDIHTYSQCDGLITNLPHTPLMVMVADCIPLLFFEPKKQVIGVAHAGRNGTYKNIAGNMVDMMIKHYQIDPKKLQIVLGPSIEQCCYEVSDELALIAKKSFGDDVVKNRNIGLMPEEGYRR